MNKLDQAREQVFYAELTAQLATRAPARGQRTRAADPPAGTVGADLDFKLPSALPALPRRPRGAAGDRGRGDPPPRRSADRAHRGRGARQVLRAVRRRRASSICWRSPASPRPRVDRETGETLAGARLRGRVPDSAVRFRRSARARRPSRPIMQAVNRLTEKAVNVRSEARDAYRDLSLDLRHRRRTTSARSCRCARSSPTRRCCATTPCRSTCSRCSRRRGSASPRPSRRSRRSATSGSPPSISRPPSSGGGMSARKVERHHAPPAHGGRGRGTD